MTFVRVLRGASLQANSLARRSLLPMSVFVNCCGIVKCFRESVFKHGKYLCLGHVFDVRTDELDTQAQKSGISKKEVVIFLIGPLNKKKCNEEFL